MRPLSTAECLELYRAAMRERQGRETPEPVAHWWDFERRSSIIGADMEQRPDAFRVAPTNLS